MTDEEEQMLDDALEYESGLTPWELDFIDNLDKVYRERELSVKQIDVLERITHKI